MSVSAIMDLAILGVLALCVVMGARKGLFRSLMGLVAVIAALAAAVWASNIAADFVIDRMLRPATEAAIEERVDQMLEEETAVSSPLEEMEEVLDAIPNDFIREQARSLLGTLGLSAEAAERSTREALLEGAGQIVDTVLDTVVRGILQSVLCFILFLLVSLVLRLATRALDITFHLPVLKQANWLGGLLFGAAKGLVLMCLGVWLLGHLGLWVTEDAIEGSYLLKIVAGWAGVSAHSVV